MAELLTLIKWGEEKGQNYQVKRNADGVISCTCIGWCLTKKLPKDRRCKHTMPFIYAEYKAGKTKRVSTS